MKPIKVVRHVRHEELGKLATGLAAAGAKVEVIDCFDDGWREFDRAGFDPEQLAGLIVMGGPMNVDQTDRYPFLAAEVGWLRQAVAAGLPTLGICLGAQLLAKVLGAEVYKNRVTEIGWYGVELTPAALDDPLLGGLPTTQTVFHWHAETFDLPGGSVLLARGATCRHQAFRYGPSAYALQFHPEMTVEMVSSWLDEPKMCTQAARTPGVDPREIRERAPVEISNSAPLAEQIFTRFARLGSEHGVVHGR